MSTALTSAKHGFLDLSTGHLPQAEMEAIAAAPPRVISHEYGAWVNVYHDQDLTGEGWEDFPVLKGLILLAREDSDVWWINFDRDASAIEELPTFDW